jgi:hypothetical protein
VNEGLEGGSPGLSTVVLAADGESTSISRRGGRGRRLGGQGGGRGDEGGPGGGSEWLVRAAALDLLEWRSSPRRSALGRGLWHREAAMRAHEGTAQWPALGAWSRCGRREAERSGQEHDGSCRKRREWASPLDQQ